MQVPFSEMCARNIAATPPTHLPGNCCLLESDNWGLKQSQESMKMIYYHKKSLADVLKTQFVLLILVPWMLQSVLS